MPHKVWCRKFIRYCFTMVSSESSSAQCAELSCHWYHYLCLFFSTYLLSTAPSCSFKLHFPESSCLLVCLFVCAFYCASDLKKYETSVCMALLEQSLLLTLAILRGRTKNNIGITERTKDNRVSTERL